MKHSFITFERNRSTHSTIQLFIHLLSVNISDPHPILKCSNFSLNESQCLLQFALVVFRFDNCHQACILCYRFQWLIDHREIIFLLWFLGYNRFILHLYFPLVYLLQVFVHFHEHDLIVHL
jgi:hypothetical protein